VGVRQRSDQRRHGRQLRWRSAIYVNRTIGTFLDLQAMNKTNVLLKMEEWGGKPVTHLPRRSDRNVDALLDTEARVV
jgi:hypothetical protein